MNNRPVVIVVEDDVELNELQRQFLDIHGMDSVPAYTGTEALRVFQVTKPAAVLLDVMLPEMDGFEICRNLRLKPGPRIPIILVTALDSEDCRRKGFQAGADAYFAKPFDPEEVIGAIQKMIEKAGV